MLYVTEKGVYWRWVCCVTEETNAKSRPLSKKAMAEGGSRADEDSSGGRAGDPRGTARCRTVTTEARSTGNEEPEVRGAIPLAGSGAICLFRCQCFLSYLKR